MTDESNQNTALEQVVDIAERKLGELKPWMTIGKSESFSVWLKFELWDLFPISGNILGKNTCPRNLEAMLLTPETSAWMRTHCLNPYWFWAVIGSACKAASRFPLTIFALEEGVNLLFQQIKTDMGDKGGISGSPQGYAGPYLPWHVWDVYKSRNLLKDAHCLELGFQSGLLMTVPLTEMRRLLCSIISGTTYNTHVAFNPIFEELAMVAPRLVAVNS